MGDQGSHNVAPIDIESKLLDRLRGGDDSAYTELWARHIGAALRYAKRCTRRDAEDLASEAFLRVYHQIRVAGNGPRDAFRAYLFTVIRNLAIEQDRERQRVSSSSDLETLAVPELIDTRDGLSLANEEAEAREALKAFQSLPSRWQRALWLVDVEDASHKDVAVDLGIKPNAVAALITRARGGLRRSWLSEQIPARLRTDGAHVADALVTLTISKTSLSTAQLGQVEQHLAVCGECASLRQDLASAYGTIRTRALKASGFAALAVTIPASHSATAAGVGAASLTIAGGSALAFGAFSGASLLIGGVLAVGLTFGNLLPSPDNAVAQTDSSETTSSESDERDRSSASASASEDDERDSATRLPGSQPDADSGTSDNTTPVIPEAAEPPTATEPPAEPKLGRNVTEVTTPVPDYTKMSDRPQDEQHPKPLPKDADIPKPGTDPTRPDPSPAVLAGLQNPVSAASYYAPMIQGKASPGSSVVVKFDDDLYAPTVASDGSWSFDFKTLKQIRYDPLNREPVLYPYEVWAYSGSETSATTPGSFTVIPIQVQGFDGTPVLPLEEAGSTGIVFSLQGPSSGQVCLSLPFSDQFRPLSLDATGKARYRILFHTGGFYNLEFKACGSSLGPTSELGLTVEDDSKVLDTWGGGFGGFGEDPTLDDLTIEPAE